MDEKKSLYQLIKAGARPVVRINAENNDLTYLCNGMLAKVQDAFVDDESEGSRVIGYALSFAEFVEYNKAIEPAVFYRNDETLATASEMGEVPRHYAETLFFDEFDDKSIVPIDEPKGMLTVLEDFKISGEKDFQAWAVAQLLK